MVTYCRTQHNVPGSNLAEECLSTVYYQSKEKMPHKSLNEYSGFLVKAWHFITHQQLYCHLFVLEKQVCHAVSS